ncbi:MAG: Maf family protein [Leptospiraceae bacterium]|nr:Maf family protein [Leptospiraceae bacterium]
MELREIQHWNDFLSQQQIKVYLASNSPRRKWILQKWGLDFEVIPPRFDEELFLQHLSTIKKQGGIWEVQSAHHKGLIHEICSNLAIQKALITWEELQQTQQKFLVLSADTLVYYNQYFLTKPQSFEEAYLMLKFLSGKTHTVVTSHCIINHNKMIITKDIMTLVTFRKLSDTDIKEYIETAEPYDKAGGYAIQGEGAILVESIVGDYLNAVGLSLNAVRFLLSEIKL